MLRVLSLNCNKGNCNGQYLGSLILEANADVICLQEFNHKVAEYLVPFKLEETYIFINSPESQGWSANVIYTKVPIVKTSFLKVEGKSRLTVVVEILIGGNKTINIACVHLDPGRKNHESRNIQFNYLLSNFNESKIPVILIGDFNLAFDETLPWPPIGWSGSQLFPTYTNQNPCVKSKRTFDYPFDRCLYKGLTLNNITTIGMNTPVSDHYGLLVDFNVVNKNPLNNCLIYHH
jgi:endonuclease/exonuclease/phosphatase family metal-dependent hydrolase